MNLMPRPPLLGEVALSVSEDDGEVVPEDDLPDVPDATGCSGRGCTEQPLPVSRPWLSLWESWRAAPERAYPSENQSIRMLNRRWAVSIGREKH